jgi:hypothetical protein
MDQNQNNMRLVAIISAWSDTKELLPFCIRNIAKVVNKVIVVYSTTSNKGNKDDSIQELVFSDLTCQWVNVEPDLSKSSHQNETDKRNYGLEISKMQGFTHFIIMDADEFYLPEEFQRAKNLVEEKGLNGIVCPLKVYIKDPTLCCDDHTLVPAIQRLKPETQVGSFKKYPFTVDSEGHVHIDPTRRVNHYDKVEMSDMFMHHMSYVRKNVDLKIDNSSASLYRSREVIYRELQEAEEGYESKLYHRKLNRVPNYFNIQI